MGHVHYAGWQVGAHQLNDGVIGIAREEERVDIGGRWIVQDYSQTTHGQKTYEIATFMSQIKLISNGSRTVVLVTTGESPNLEEWRMIASDDPAVAAVIKLRKGVPDSDQIATRSSSRLAYFRSL